MEPIAWTPALVKMKRRKNDKQGRRRIEGEASRRDSEMATTLDSLEGTKDKRITLTEISREKGPITWCWAHSRK